MTPQGAGYDATARLTVAGGCVVRIDDHWSEVDEFTVRVDRRITVLEAGTSSGVRVELTAATTLSGIREFDDVQLFIPGALYGKNDSDGDGVEDYLGTYVQDYRDDRLACLGVAVFAPGRETYAALTRADVPAGDPAVTAEQLASRHFVQDTAIGSLGLAPAGDGRVRLRASLPFVEEHSFCLNTRGEGWAAYLPARPGAAWTVSYHIRLAPAATLCAAIWDLTRHQMTALDTAARDSGCSLERSVGLRLEMTDRCWREWPALATGPSPAGYLVHFSPRSGETSGTLLEYGFSGAQTLLAWAGLRHGHRQGDAGMVARARRVAQFFVDHCLRKDGSCEGLYDPERDAFVHWFTGILMPFQYAAGPAELRACLGSQIVDALGPVAEQLRRVAGNYTRSMCEAFSALLLAYEVEVRHGTVHADWLRAAQRFGTFLLDRQQPDGSWCRAYDGNGRGLTEPAVWFGASHAERGSGTLFPIPVLLALHSCTGEDAYLAAARRAGEFLIDTYVRPVAYVGGLNDTTHVKSVKADSVGVMFVMRSLGRLFEATGDQSHLAAAADAARALASWIYLWDVPFPPGSLLDRSGFRSTGWAVCDALPAGSYLDNELLEFVGDLVKVAAHARDERLLDIAEIAAYGLQFALSTPEKALGYVAPGIQCEGVLTSYWLSDPDTTTFSGAVNKTKGDDNDTCNGLTNGQAAYGFYDLLDTFGTADFGRLRQLLFPQRAGLRAQYQP